MNKNERIGLFFELEDGRDIVRVLEAFRRLRAVKYFSGWKPFLRHLSMLKGGEIHVLQSAIEKIKKVSLTAEVIVLPKNESAGEHTDSQQGTDGPAAGDRNVTGFDSGRAI